jgi:nicotinamide mononucleotide adenylyltransferase
MVVTFSWFTKDEQQHVDSQQLRQKEWEQETEPASVPECHVKFIPVFPDTPTKPILEGNVSEDAKKRTETMRLFQRDACYSTVICKGIIKYEELIKKCPREINQIVDRTVRSVDIGVWRRDSNNATTLGAHHIHVSERYH